MAANNFDKLWIQSRLNDVAISRANEAINRTGRSLPCHVIEVTGSIVTVAFDINSAPFTLPNLTIPKLESNWMREPTQIGDKGFTIPADVYIGYQSGMSNVPPTMQQPPNLSALVFVPLSNANTPPPDQNAAICQGPNGFIGQTTAGIASNIIVNQNNASITYGSASVTLNASGITLSANGQTLIINSSGVIINGLAFGTHYHGGIQPGSGNTSGPA